MKKKVKKYEENAKKLNSRKIILPRTREKRYSKMADLGVYYCQDCRKYFSVETLKENLWWNGDPKDSGDSYRTCPKNHQILE